MSVDLSDMPRPLPALLTEVKMAAVGKLLARLADEGFDDFREGYGCVFGFIDTERGSRLTNLAERSGLTKQAVGEVVDELERIGYVTRVPDPLDRRAKLITLTERGAEACHTGRRLFAEIEREWAEELGAELVYGLREAAQRICELEHAPITAAGRARA